MPAAKSTRKSPAKPAAAPAKRTTLSPVASKSDQAVPAAKKSQATTLAAAKPGSRTESSEKSSQKAVVRSAPAKNAAAKNAAPKEKAPPAPKEKTKKDKLIRDSFTMPEAEYQVLGDMKKACLKAGVDVKKSELLRVGVALIKDMDIDRLKSVLAALPPLKAGRPKKDK